MITGAVFHFHRSGSPPSWLQNAEIASCPLGEDSGRSAFGTKFHLDSYDIRWPLSVGMLHHAATPPFPTLHRQSLSHELLAATPKRNDKQDSSNRHYDRNSQDDRIQL